MEEQSEENVEIKMAELQRRKGGKVRIQRAG
jgi:hypothetical protein